jgi:hypothetical protein
LAQEAAEQASSGTRVDGGCLQGHALSLRLQGVPSNLGYKRLVEPVAVDTKLLTTQGDKPPLDKPASGTRWDRGCLQHHALSLGLQGVPPNVDNETPAEPVAPNRRGLGFNTLFEELNAVPVGKAEVKFEGADLQATGFGGEMDQKGFA